jgi:hypothetical protein
MRLWIVVPPANLAGAVAVVWRLGIQKSSTRLYAIVREDRRRSHQVRIRIGCPSRTLRGLADRVSGLDVPFAESSRFFVIGVADRNRRI